MRHLVLPLVHAARIHAPELRRARAVPERLEWNGELRGPPAVKRADAEIEHRVPVAIPPLARDLSVLPPADWIDEEADTIAAVVERVEHNRQALVLKGVGAVLPH